MSDFPVLERYQEKFGYVLDDGCRERLKMYRSLLIEWSARFNLTRVTDPEGIETKLFLDSLAIAPLLNAVSRRNRPIRMIDVGAGAGLPGLPLKIAFPEIDLVLLEATAKKVAFLKEVIQVLGLTGVDAIHGRAEELGHDQRYRGQFDVVLARAVARLPALLELCMPLCRVGGRGLFPKGVDIDEEIADARHAAGILGSAILGTERSDAEEVSGTTIVVVQQQTNAPVRYPRRAGLPAKDPL